MTTTKERTDTPQEYYPHVGNLESQDAIATIARQMLTHSQAGLWAVALGDEERSLLGKFEALLSGYQQATRAEWAGLKESCLLLLGSEVASVIDHLVSAMRTPAIAESAIRSAGWQLIKANQTKAEARAQDFMRSILRETISGTSPRSQPLPHR